MSALNPQARQVLDLMAASGQPTLDQLDPVSARTASKMGLALLQGPRAEMVEVRDLQAPGPAGPIALRLYRPAAAPRPAPALIYFHGGGFVIGDLELYDQPCRALAEAAACVVISVDYRLAPEHPFPAAPEDAWAVTRWVVAEAAALGVDASRLAVGGDSAGGNLAAGVALCARDAGLALRHQLLIYPVVDAGGGTESLKERAEGYFLTAALMAWFLNHYVRDPAQVADWRLSPLRAPSHAGVAPASILVCGYDPLHDDGVRYAEALRRAGVAVSFRDVPDQIHGFQLMDGLIPAAREANAWYGERLRQAFA
ncbi:MAG TPA: alpha/beta hydrolase [Nevskiaceae bacterium]|nr:alpha/beta hydrolase [Nevskiaceae bacterium]